MKPVYRWIIRHPRLSRLMISLVITVFSLLLLNPNLFPFIVRYLAIFMSLYYGFQYVNTCPERLIREPLEILEQQCDPGPFLEEMALMQDFPPDHPQAQIMRINYAMALRQVGEYEHVLEILRELNLEENAYASPLTKLVWYNNLSDVLTKLERFDEAEHWYEKALSIYHQLPEGKTKEHFSKTMELAQAESLFRQRDYAIALRKLSRISCRTQRYLMDAALVAARCHVALEEYDKAREKLSYIQAHGNKLHCVKEAETLLASLP